MKFKYLGLDPEKNIAKGTVQADSEQEARAQLKSKQIEIIKLEQDKWGMEINLSFGSISSVDRLFFTKHLGIMLKAGIPLFEAVEMLRSQATGKLQSILNRVVKQLGAGSTLSKALAEHPKAFPEIFVQLIGSGELAGTLEKNLNYISTFTQKEIEMKKKVMSALLYPSLVFMAVLGLALSIGLFVLPQLLPLFDSLDTELPSSTKILLWCAEFFRDHGSQAVLGVAIAILVTPFALRSYFIKPLWHASVLHLPVAGSIIREVSLGQFFRVFATLMEAGIPIDQSLEVAQKVIHNLSFKKAILAMQRSVVKGDPLSRSVQDKTFLFPPLVTHMMQVGENTGNLGESFEYLAKFYEDEVDEKLKNLSTLLEPLLLVFIGILVGGVAFAIIGPIYSLSGSIR